MVKKYLAYFTAIAGRDILLAILVLFVLGLMEGIGLMMIIPLLSIIGITEQEIINNQITLKLTQLADFVGVSLSLVSLLIAFVLLMSAREYFLRLQTIQGNHIQQKVVNRFRQRLYESLVYSRWLFFTCERSSDMTQTLTQDINRIGMMVMFMIRMMSTAVIASVYLISSMIVSFEMTLITVGSALVLLWLSRHKFKVAEGLGSAFTKHNNQMYALISEGLGGIKTAKCYGAEQRQVEDFSENLDKLYEIQDETCKSRANAKIMFGLGTALILAGFLYIGVEFLQLSATSILLLVFLFSRLSPRVSMLQQDFLRLVNALPALEAYDQILSRAQKQSEKQISRLSLSAPLKSIALQNVNFSYQHCVSSKDVKDSKEIPPNTLIDIQLNITIGQSIGIVGPSGAGKSTFADILMGLIQPTSGYVCLDGNKLSQEQLILWRKQVAYVSQEPHFLHDSIRNNLLWCKPTATEQELLSVLERSCALSFVMKLPQGLDSPIGDRGNCLSGGERQRLAIARALLFEPTLLILDEATSGLDERTQHSVMEQLMLLKGKVTLVMITHRLSILESFDAVYMMDSGVLKLQ